MAILPLSQHVRIMGGTPDKLNMTILLVNGTICGYKGKLLYYHKVRVMGGTSDKPKMTVLLVNGIICF